jgi:hypothetical protein
MPEKHPAAIQFGVPRSKPRYGRAGGDVASEHNYIFGREAGNTVNALETAK